MPHGSFVKIYETFRQFIFKSVLHVIKIILLLMAGKSRKLINRNYINLVNKR